MVSFATNKDADIETFVSGSVGYDDHSNSYSFAGFISFSPVFSSIVHCAAVQDENLRLQGV